MQEKEKNTQKFVEFRIKKKTIGKILNFHSILSISIIFEGNIFPVKS